MLSSRRFQAGTVHYCDYDEFAPKGSEMVKGRGVVIVSPSQRRDADLVVIVPLSTLPPSTHTNHAVHIMHEELNGRNGGCWAKCDMPSTVSLTRLTDYRRPKYKGQNNIPTVTISGDELLLVRKSMILAIGAKEILIREREQRNAARAIGPLPSAKPVRKATPPPMPRNRRPTSGVNRPIKAQRNQNR